MAATTKAAPDLKLLAGGARGGWKLANSKLRLSRWAEGYEREQSKIGARGGLRTTSDGTRARRWCGSLGSGRSTGRATAVRGCSPRGAAGPDGGKRVDRTAWRRAGARPWRRSRISAGWGSGGWKAGRGRSGQLPSNDSLRRAIFSAWTVVILLSSVIVELFGVRRVAKRLGNGRSVENRLLRTSSAPFSSCPTRYPTSPPSPAWPPGRASTASCRRGPFRFRTRRRCRSARRRRVVLRG